MLFIVNRVYLFNYVKLLEIQDQVKKTQEELELLQKQMNESNSSNENFESTAVVSVTESKKQINLLELLEHFQNRTSLFIESYFENEDGTTGFEVPLIDNPNQIFNLDEQSVLDLESIKLMESESSVFDDNQKDKFQHFIDIYSDVMKITMNDDNEMDTYQRMILEKLEQEDSNDYQYVTFNYWKQELAKFI